MEAAHKIERLVVRGVNWLGDAVMTTPLLLRLREALPAAHIALVTLYKLADLWKGHAAINEVIPFEKARGVGALATEIKRRKFDSALILPNSFRSALEIWLAGVPVRIGYGGKGRGLLLTKVVPKRAEEVRMHKRSEAEVRLLIATAGRKRETFPVEGHQIFNYLHLGHALGATSKPTAPRLNVSEAEKESLRQKFGIASEGRLFGINSGAEYGPAKRWPLERFIETALEVHSRSGWRCLIFGGKADVDGAATIQNALVSRFGPKAMVNLAGETSLRELCVALSLCEVIATNDTGPMHVAAAVGTRVVVPFGSTSPELTGPGLPGTSEHDLVLGTAECAPCFRRECPIDFRCMNSIPSKTIQERIFRTFPC